MNKDITFGKAEEVWLDGVKKAIETTGAEKLWFYSGEYVVTVEKLKVKSSQGR